MPVAEMKRQPWSRENLSFFGWRLRPTSRRRVCTKQHDGGHSTVRHGLDAPRPAWATIHARVIQQPVGLKGFAMLSSVGVIEVILGAIQRLLGFRFEGQRYGFAVHAVTLLRRAGFVELCVIAKPKSHPILSRVPPRIGESCQSPT